MTKGGDHGHIKLMSYTGIHIKMKYFEQFTTPESILGFIGAGSLATINFLSKAEIIEKTTAIVAALIALAIAIIALLIQLKKLRQESIRLMIEEMNFKKMQEELNKDKENGEGV